METFVSTNSEENTFPRLRAFCISSFLPLGSFAIYMLTRAVRLRWIFVLEVLKILSMVSMKWNVDVLDFKALRSSISAYLLLSTSIFLKGVERQRGVEASNNKTEDIEFSRLAKICANNVLSNVAVVCLSILPLVAHSFVDAKVYSFYSIDGPDYLMHAWAGFGVGLISIAAYNIANKAYGYDNLIRYFRLSKYDFFEKTQEIGDFYFVIFSTFVICAVWELREEILEKYTTRVVNIFFWNGLTDIIMGVLGAILAWGITRKLLAKHLFSHALRNSDL